MDDNKDLEENLNEENTVSEETEETTESKAEKILSGLAGSAIPDAVRDWDEVLPEDNNSVEQLIEDTHIISEENEDFEAPEIQEEEIPEEERCIECGKNKRCTSISEDYEYCAECRIKMLKRRLPAMGIVTFILVLLVFLFSLFTFVQNGLVGVSVFYADRLANKGYLQNSVSAYEDAFKIAKSANMSSPVNAIERYIKVLSRISDPIKVTNTLNEYLSTYEVKSDPELKKLLEDSDKFQNTVDACNKVVSKYYDSATGAIDYQKSYIGVKKMLDDKTGKYDIDTIYYFLADLSTNSNKADDTLKYLEKIRKHSPDKFWFYNMGNSLSDIYIDRNDYDSALKLADDILKIDKGDQNANWLKASYAIVNNKPNDALAIANELSSNDKKDKTSIAINAFVDRINGKYDKVISTCKKAVEEENCNAEVYYQYIVALLLNGDTETANSLIQNYGNYISSYYDRDKAMSVCTLTALISGDLDTFDQMKYAYKTQPNLVYPKELTQFENNKIKLEDIFMKGDYELS